MRLPCPFRTAIGRAAGQRGKALITGDATRPPEAHWSSAPRVALEEARHLSLKSTCGAFRFVRPRRSRKRPFGTRYDRHSGLSPREHRRSGRSGQTMRLEHAGAIRVFADVRSGKSMDRPGLTELLAYARRGDSLAAVRLDRPGRSRAELLSVVEQLKGRGVALLSLEKKINTSSAAGELISTCSARSLISSGGLSPNASKTASRQQEHGVRSPAVSRSMPTRCRRHSGSWSPACRPRRRPSSSTPAPSRCSCSVRP